MNSFLGIEMTNQQAFMILAVLSVISFVMAICGGVLYMWAEKKHKYDYGLCGIWLQVLGCLGVLIFASLAGCFK